ncbi:MAG: polyphosphate kinase 2 family protein [Bacteroidia bacterium]|nr:polyphosphate kinase 2 family protein [Bacteroidia bacterium]
MQVNIDIHTFEFKGEKKFDIQKTPTQIPDFYRDKDHYKNLMEEFQEEIDELQTMMYAHDRYALLLIFQAMDAAGKDGTIQKVMSGINPHGVDIYSFKKPSDSELDHDFLWRTTVAFPQRGKIGIFNRSYYEEVLVVKVHPEILTRYQRLPAELVIDPEEVWKQRYEDIRNLEKYAYRNGIRVVKFFLNISKDEQRKRFLSRLNEPDKNWKFAEADVKERSYWDKYMEAYQSCINATATPEAPWYVIPADDKNNMRLIVAKVILAQMEELDMKFPAVDEARKAEFQKFREMLEKD